MILNNCIHKIYNINFDEISVKILNSIPKKNRNFVRNQLNLIDENFLDYIIFSFFNMTFRR